MKFLLKMLCAWMISALLGINALDVAATEEISLYISPNGNDDHNGLSPTTAVKTLMKIMTLLAENKGKNISVNLGGGTYYLAAPLEFTLANTQGSKISFKPLNNEKVVFSGAQAIENPVWINYNDQIKQTNIGAGKNFEIMFLNAQMKILARYPNYRDDEPLNGGAADAISPERVAKWANPTGGFIRALHSKSWGGNDYLINAKNADNTLNYTWVGDNNRGDGMHQTVRMVENIFEELDAPNEWFYNKSTGDLYYYPENNAELKNAHVAVATLPELARVVGDSVQNPVQDISFENITFTQTNRTMFNIPYERPLRGDWGLARTGALYFENAKNITVKNCTFEYLGGNAIMMSAYNAGHLVDYNDFTHLGASAVLIVGLESATRDPSTWDNKKHKTKISDPTPGPLTEDYPREIKISNNYIYNSGKFEKQSAGVSISIARRITVSKNTIHYVPRAGINVSDGTFGGHLIEGNDIFDTVRETSDHGPFNSWGRDRFWSLDGFNVLGNNGDKKVAFAKLDAIETTIIRNNRIAGNHGFGLDLDDGSSNYEIYNNLLLGVGIKLREGFYRTVYNNVIIGNPLNIHCTFTKNHDKIYRNLVINNNAVNYAGGANNTERRTDVFEKNLYWNNGDEVVNSTTADGMGLIADPKFIKTAIDNNFQVAPTSPALSSTIGFKNFAMSDAAFGRAEKPKPAIYTFAKIQAQAIAEEFLGTTLKPLTEALCSAYAIPFDTQGIAFFAIAPNSYFATSGFLNSDTVCALNGVPTATIKEFQNAFAQLPSNQTVNAKIIRMGIEKEVKFTSPMKK